MLVKVEPEAFLADKAYDADEFINILEDRKFTPFTPKLIGS